MAGPATLDELVAAFPGRGADPAILGFGAGGGLARVTYATLHEDLARFASLLHDRGIRDGALVLLWAPNSPAWIAAYLGIVAAGNVVIPLDDQADGETLDVVRRRSSPACIVTVAAHLDALRAGGFPAHTPIFLLEPDDEARSWRRVRAEAALPQIAPDERRVAALLYTSGTTGTPKGVFPVDPDRDLGRGIALAAQVLAAGDVLVWFPEGRRSRDGRLQPFRPGIGMLLEQAPVPVVPARIEGTFAAWPPHRRWPRLGRVSVTFGRPETVADLRETGEGEGGPARIGNALARRVADL